MMSPFLFQNTFVVRRTGLAIFADIIKTVTVFIKKYLMTQEKLKEIDIMYQNGINIFIFWYSKICCFPAKKR